MKKKNLKSLKLNKKSISNFENVAGGDPRLTFITNGVLLLCCFQLTGSCDPPMVTEDCQTELFCG
ncbi:hypothetical protein EZY14_019090 [Kordia sp. TARA_039_SRF]|nr:hypothetical protein EZY14_019090 [Kordia sp. TARA_039_SRF]